MRAYIRHLFGQAAGPICIPKRRQGFAWLFAASLFGIASVHATDGVEKSDREPIRRLEKSDRDVVRPIDMTVQMTPLGARALWQPTRPLSMGGYIENHGGAARKWLNDTRTVYLEEKAELEAAMHACDLGRPDCDPQIKEMSVMLAAAPRLPDRLTQIETVNAWVNGHTVYDHDEEHERRPLRTMLEFVADGAGTCHGYARVKLALLEMLGFDRQDIRYVWLASFIDNAIERDDKGRPVTHAVAEVRIGGENWILDDNTAYGSGDARIASASRIENDLAKLNFSGNSVLWGKGQRFQPIGEFNSVQAADYVTASQDYTLPDPAPPVAAMTAPVYMRDLSTVLTKNDATALFVRQVETTAFPPAGMMAAAVAPTAWAQNFGALRGMMSDQDFIPVMLGTALPADWSFFDRQTRKVAPRWQNWRLRLTPQ